MEAIRTGEVQEGQRAQRNAYFEQLSNQLKELRANEASNPPGAAPLPLGAGAAPQENAIPAHADPRLDPRVVGAPGAAPPVGVFPPNEVVISDDEEESMNDDSEDSEEDDAGDNEDLYESGEEVDSSAAPEPPDLTGIGQ